ncbi:MAG: hypothetical protein ABI224_07005 [Acetobacteraceae bacterium]
MSARDWGGTGPVILVQTSDPFVYFDMLVASSRANRAFCERHGIAYAAFVGIKRGFHPWQATFNRIVLLAEYMEQGYAGWVLYLDADALVAAPDWDIRAYLAGKSGHAAILTPGDEGAPDWGVNAGVGFFNLGQAGGRALIEAWRAAFACLDDAALRAAGRWDLVANDQDMLQAILRADPALRAQVFLESPAHVNSREASLIRQVLRAQEPDMAARVRAVEAEALHFLSRIGNQGK